LARKTARPPKYDGRAVLAFIETIQQPVKTSCFL